eukprot:1067922-Pelagomonas_calceolata.AAC.9
MNSLSEPWPMYYTQDWGRKDFEDYALEEKQDDIRPLLAFIAMGIISLLRWSTNLQGLHLVAVPRPIGPDNLVSASPLLVNLQATLPSGKHLLLRPFFIPCSPFPGA